jgi:RHS repeat-associated protein
LLTNSFKYDPWGRRIYKSSSSGTSVYAYEGDNVIEETNASGGVVARYSQGLNIDEPLAMLRSSTTSYYQADGLGSVTSLSNGAGSLAQTYSFDSFGKTTPTGSLVNPFQYTGRESDSETGLYYYRARYYDPTAGRFLSEDPERFRAGIDFYSYVFNTPPNANDPTGLDCKTYLFLTLCNQEGMYPSQIAGENAHEAQHRADNALLTVLSSPVIALYAPKIPKVCQILERRGFEREFPILEKRINELRKKKCLTDEEKKELRALQEQYDTAKTLATDATAIREYCRGR